MLKVELPQTLETAVQDYFDWAEFYLRGVEQRTAITSPLYHYTNMTGLKGILTTDEIWFTDYRHLNDPDELLHGIKIARTILQKRFSVGGLQSILYQWIDDLLTQKNFSRALEFFIASFSRERDELGQWRAYADDGRGVTIGLSPKLFSTSDTISEDPINNSYVGPVFYKDAQTRARHLKGIDKVSTILGFAQVYARHHLRDKTIGMEFLNRLARAVIAAPLIWNALTCKHSGYENEHEVRLLVVAEKKKFKGKISTRKRKKETVPYISRSLHLHEGGSILEIVVGPAAPKDAEAQIKKMLRSAGIKYSIPIKRSKIPYRAI